MPRERLPEAAVEPWGLAGDRRWMIVDPGGDVVTARERPRLLLVTPFPGDDAIRLTGLAMPDLTVPVPAGDDLIPVTVWDSKLLASPAGDAADAWLSEVAGEPVRLVYLDDPTRLVAEPPLQPRRRPGLVRRRLPAAGHHGELAGRPQRADRGWPARRRGPVADAAVPAQRGRRRN